MKNWIPTKSFTKSSLKILMPVIMGQLLFSGVYFLDNFMASPLGPEGVSAVGAANEYIFLVSTFLIGISTMTDIVAAQYFGAKKMEEFHESTRIKFKMVVSIGLLLTLGLFVFPDQLMGVFNLGGGNKNVVDQGSPYLKLMAIGNVFYVFTQVLVSTLGVIGKTKYILYSALISIGFNFTFNYLFVNVYNMGASGLAYSTIGSRIFEFLFFAFFMFVNRKVAWWGWTLKSGKTLFRKIIKNHQVAFGQLFWALGIATQTIVWSAYYSDDVLAGVFFAYAITGIMFTSFSAIHLGVKVLVGQTLGTGDFKKAREISSMLLPVIMGISLVLVALTLIVGFAIPWGIIIDDATKETTGAIHGIVGILASIFPFYIVTNFAFSHLEAAGFTKMSTIFDKYTQFFVMVPLGWIICEYSGLDIIPVFAIIHYLNVLPILLAWPAYRSYTWLRNITHEHTKGHA